MSNKKENTLEACLMETNPFLKEYNMSHNSRRVSDLNVFKNEFKPSLSLQKNSLKAKYDNAREKQESFDKDQLLVKIEESLTSYIPNTEAIIRIPINTQGKHLTDFLNSFGIKSTYYDKELLIHLR